MGFMDEYYKALKDDSTKGSSSGSGGGKSGGSSFMEEYNKAGGSSVFAKNRKNTSDAPISKKLTSSYKKRKKEEEEEKKKRKWFDKGLFDDGYDFGDITKTILGTGGDVVENLVTGIAGMGEKVVDAGAYLAPYMANGQFYQNGGIYDPKLVEQQEKVFEQSKEDMGKFIAKDLYDEEALVKGFVTGVTGVDVDDYSVLGEKSDALAQSGGQLLATVGLQAVGVPWFVTTGATSFGGEAENALHEGASYGEAGASAAISAGAEILSEKLSGGISFGGKTFDDAFTKKISRDISNKVFRTVVKLTADMGGEGLEEVFSGAISAVGQKLTYADEKELNELFSKEDAWESFIGGAVLGGASGSYNAVKSAKNGVDYASELTNNEQKVVDKVYKDRVAKAKKDGKVTEKQKAEIYDKVLRDMEKGYIPTDTIEEVLGGEKYSQYKQAAEWEDSLQNEFDKLNKMKQGEMTGEQVDRREALRNQLKNVKATSTLTQQRTQIRDEVMSLVKGDRLVESYNEQGRRGQAFEADVTKYDAKQQVVIQKAIDSGILNNTNRTHEFVDIISKIFADKGVLFNFTNNKKLKESGFAVDGKQVNGFVTKDGISINIDSPKAWQSTVGHEVTHVLEGTEFYTELQNTLFEYAKTKGEYDSRFQTLTELYKDVKDADINAELTADLVGEYLFTDEDFIKNLSTQNKNLFQKIYDEIKYLYKVATGSKEAKELEKVKRAFEKVYKEGGKTPGETKYSISETTDGRFTAVVDSDILSSIDTSSWDKETKKAAKRAASEALKKFSDGIEVSDMRLEVSKTTRDEYTRSAYSEMLARKNPAAYGDKMRASANIDDVVHVVTDWSRDGVLRHDRDDFADFARGKTLIMSGDRAYNAEVVVGIRANGEAVLYDVVDINPDSFEIKKAEPPTAVSTNELSNAIQEGSAGDKLAQDSDNVKHSLSGSAPINEVTENGLTMTYVRVPNQNTPYYGSTYGQNIEPAGEYMSMDTMQGKNKIDGYEYGTIQFKKPLVLEHINTGDTGWKKTVSDMYGGLTGKKLTKALIKDGYDAIVTYDDYGYSEIVNLNGKKLINGTDNYSLSNLGEQHTPDSLSALRLEAPVSKTAAETKTPISQTNIAPTVSEMESVAEAPVTADDMSALFPNNAVPVQEELEQLVTERDQLYKALELAVDRGSAAEVGKLAEEYEAINSRIKALESEDSERIGSLTDAPPEMDAPFYGDSESVTVDDPFEERDWYKVGNQKVKAYMYENPEVKPFFQAEAQNLLGELSDTQKGERWYNDDVYYASGGEKGFDGQKRIISDSMATLLDEWGMSYADIEKGLNAIIEDNGAENIAAAKKIEFMLNDRLLNGYKDFYTNGRIEPNQDYINLLNEKQISSYSKEAFDQFMANADQYAPSQEEYYAPILNSDPRYEQTSSTYDLPGGQQTYVPTKATYDATPTDDIAPLFDATGKKGVPDGQQAFMPDAGVEKKQTRKEYHQGIIDNIKSVFKGRGFDFDKVLKNAKNLSTWSTVDNTPQRVMEKALGYKEGGILADITVNKVAQNETEGIKWLNAYVKQLKQISKQYGIKPGSKESAAAQMFAEGFYVNKNNEIVRYGEPELIQDFGNADVRRRIKGLARDPRIRKIYDDTLGMINESRTRNLYPEIPRLDNYFLHFRAMNDTFSTLGLPFNPNDIKAKDLPTDLNGVTADLKPGQPYFSSAMHRTGKRTSFDLLGGVERYLNSAKNQIYHIDDIQTLRALRNYIAETYGQAAGLEDIDSMSDVEAEERIKQVYDSHLSTFAKFLNEEANVLAGKTALIDRGAEGLFGRRAMTFMKTLSGQVGSNQVGYNISSSLTNFMPVAQTFANTNKFDFIKAFGQTVLNKFSGGRFDTFSEDSPVVIRRKGEDRFYQTPWQKMQNPGYALMGAVDNISTELIARTKYNEFTRKGMDSQKAHFETDKWVSRLMGDRSLGQQPQLYNSNFFGLFTKYQLEVRNYLDSAFYDTIQEVKASNEDIQNGLARNAKTAAKVTSRFIETAVVMHLFGKAFESVAGYNPSFDIVEALMTAFGYDDDEGSEDTTVDNLAQALMVMAEDMPYASFFLEGGRIPIASAIPDVPAVMRGEDQYGNDIGWKKAAVEEFDAVAPYYLLPGGGGQIKKTVAGLKMFSDDHPIAGSYTEAGNLRYPVEDTAGNRIKAGIFGQYASENAQKYFDQEQRTLNPEQTEIFAGLDIPIEEYWEYRDDLYEFYDVRDALKDAAFADEATDEDKLKGWYVDAISDELYDLYEQQTEIASGDSKNKKSDLRKLQDQMKQILTESKYAVDRMKLTGLYGEVGDKRYNKDADSGRWYEITPKNADGSDNWYYVQEKLSHDKLGMSYDDYWNGKDPSATNQTYYGEYNGKRYNYDAEEKQWYEITPKNDDGTDNWYYQMEQKVTKGLGISYEEYWSKPKEYNFAYENPGQYAVAQAVGGYDSYKEHYDILKNSYSDNYLRADKDKYGNSIDGSRKKKVLDYINGLDIDYGERLILYRTVYSSKADKRAYNQQIIDYLNERDDISYQEMKTILEELEMEVDDEGYISW